LKPAPRSILAAVFLFCLFPASRMLETGSATRNAGVVEAYGRLPLGFDCNDGQTDSRVKFTAAGPGYALFLTGDAAVLRLDDRVLRMRLAGARAERIEGLDALEGKSNYFLGNDPRKWRRDVARYRKVRYRRLYPGIDLVFHGAGGRLEYDFVVAPGADPARIRLAFDGARVVRLEQAGDLAVDTGSGELRVLRPSIYAERPEGRMAVGGRFRPLGGAEVGIDVDPYDRGTPLVIDPVLSYSSVFGGSGADFATGIAVDSQGNAYVTGSAASTDFPTTSAGVSPTGGTSFVAELDAAGRNLLYSTYFGGSGSDASLAIAVDRTGAAYVAGSTNSADFPVTPEAFRTAKAAGSDAFVCKLVPGGSALAYSTFVGGGGSDAARAIAVDSSGNAYVAGSTASIDFPTTAGAFRTVLAGGSDAFALKLNPFGTALVYSTLLGGSSADNGTAVAVDASGNAYLAGDTASSDFPTTAAAVQANKRGGTDGFAAKLDPSGKTLLYSTFLGGAGEDLPRAVAVDGGGSAYVAGSTGSANFPTTSGAYRTASAGASAAFVTKLDALGRTLAYSALISAGASDAAAGIAVDALGNAYVAGSTTSSGLPVSADAFQKSFASAAAYKSSDSGASWSPSSSGFGGFSTLAFALDPVNASIAYAGTDTAGIFKTTDGGKSWSAASAGLTDLRVPVLAIDPRTPATLMAGTSRAGVFRSLDGGANWMPVNSGFPPAPSGSANAVNALAIDPANTAVVYAGTTGGLFKTTNSGASWSAADSGLLDPNITALAIDPTETETVYCAAGSIGTFKTFTAGVRWIAVNLGQPRAVITSILVDPRFPTNVYAALSGLGVYMSDDAGRTWLLRSLGLQSTSVTALALDPTFTSRIYAATSDRGLFKTFDRAMQWDVAGVGLTSKTVDAIAVHPTNPANVFAGTPGGEDAFVVKLNPAGSALLYATYLGGTGADAASALALDSTGSVYVAGGTVSLDFLATSGAFKTPLSHGRDVFATKIAADPTLPQVTLFAQVAVGKGYTTTFILENTGSARADGTLSLRDQQGEPLSVTLTDAASGQAPAQGSSFSLAIAAGAVRVLTAERPSASDTLTGWARADTLGGALAGVSTFQFTEDRVLKAVAGVLGSAPISVATLPVDNDDAESRFTGFAVANYNTEEIGVKIVTLDERGAVSDVITPRDLNPLPPGHQAAKFLHEYLPGRLKFRGSAVLIARGGKKFSVVALLSNQGLLTAIPVVAEKASNVPD